MGRHAQGYPTDRVPLIDYRPNRLIDASSIVCAYHDMEQRSGGIPTLECQKVNVIRGQRGQMAPPSG